MNNNQPDTNQVIIDAIQDRKGSAISILNLENIDGASTGKFYICTGRNTTQVAAIADNIRDKLLEDCGLKPYNYDGYRNSQWIILDYGDFMIHIFLPDFRSFYNLEELWSDAPVIKIEDLE